MVHRQRGTRQAAEERRHFTLGQEAGGAFGEAVGGRAAQLRLEDGQRAAHVVTAHLHRTARFGEANQGHQNMLQAKWQKQTLAGAEDHRTEISRAVDDAANTVDAHRKDRPDQRND